MGSSGRKLADERMDGRRPIPYTDRPNVTSGHHHPRIDRFGSHLAHARVREGGSTALVSRHMLPSCLPACLLACLPSVGSPLWSALGFAAAVCVCVCVVSPPLVRPAQQGAAAAG